MTSLARWRGRDTATSLHNPAGGMWSADVGVRRSVRLHLTMIHSNSTTLEAVTFHSLSKKPIANTPSIPRHFALPPKTTKSG